MVEKERVQFKLMVPAELKARLEDAAHEARRSLSAEIIARLEESLQPTSDRSLLDAMDEQRLMIETLIEQTAILREKIGAEKK